MAITEDILVRLRVAGQGQFASAMGGAATQTGKLGTQAKTTAGRVEAVGGKAKKAKGEVSGFAGGVAKFAGAAAALAGAQKVIKDSVGNAVDLGEQMSKSATVFRGPGAKSVQAWSKTTASSLGVSQAQALEATGVMGNMLVPMGIGRKKAAEMSKQFVGLGADMASFNNASPEETMDALRSGLAGETEPLRKFGVFLNDARVKQEAMKQGLYDGKGPLDAQAKALATSAIIMRDSKDAQGDFAKTSDSLANRQRILKAQYENATAAIGQRLLPVLSLLANNLDAVAIAVGVVAAGFVVWAITTGAVSTAFGALSAAMLANPIGVIVIAIIALIAGLVILYRKCTWFRNAVKAVWAAIKVGVSAAMKGVVAAFNWVKTAATNTWRWIRTAFGNVVNFVKGLPGKIRSATSGLWDGIKAGFKGALNAIIGWWNDFQLSVNIPDAIPGMPDSFTIRTPNVPMLAGGGTITSGGAAIVGERGPELVTLPTGAGVIPNGGGVIHTHVYLNGREIATAVGNAAADRKARR